MDAGRIDGVHARARPGSTVGNDRAGQLVNQLAEDRVFLRRPADDGERPDRAVAVIDVLDAQHREIVLQAVVAQVIAERAFGQQLVGDRPCRRCRNRRRRGSAGRPRPAEHADAAAAERAGEGQFAHSFGQRHHGGEHHRRRAADEDVDAKRLAGANRRRMMHADPAVNLVVQADFAVRLVLAAGELHAVHAEVRAPPARRRGRLRCRPAAA